MNTLWVTGDSFSVIIPDDQDKTPWSVQLANQLNYNLKNASEWGVCQDWSWDFIDREKDNILPDDQLVIVLTDPARFWFFEDFPSLTNSHVIDFNHIIGDQDRTRAATSYIRYIQRPSLDTQMMTHRLGWLNNLATARNWKNPIVILAFNMILPKLDDFTKLIFSNGCLRDVDLKEHMPSFKINTIDIRYNHLCLCNHIILANKLYSTIINNEKLDLSNGFHEQILSNNSIADAEFIKTELSQWLIEKSKSIKIRR